MLKRFAFLMLVCTAAPALAQEENPAIDVSINATFLSDHRFRGVSRSDEDPAVQAGIVVSHRSGAYAGVRGTTLAGLDGFRLRDPGFGDQGDAQFDIYAGYGADLGGGFSLDAGLMAYVFAGSRGNTDHVEPYASLAYLIGPVELSAGAKYAPSQDGTGNEDMLYVYGEVEAGIPFRPISFTAQLGRQDWGRYGSYWSWSLGGSYRLPIGRFADAEIGLSYVDTNLTSAPGRDAGVVLSIGFDF